MTDRPRDMRPLVELIERYDPGFASRIQPAPADTVEDLVALAGPLPGVYQRFLATMGGDTGGFAPADGDYNVEDRLLNYQLNESLQGVSYLLIAAGGPTEPGGSIFLDRATTWGQDDCLVTVATYDRQMTFADVAPFHAGFEELLYLEAYRIYRMPQLPAGIELALRPEAVPSPAIVERVLAIARELGFTAVPPVTRSALLERGDAAMMLYRPPTSDLFSLRIGAMDLDEVKKIGDLFVEQAPLRVMF